MPTYRKRGSRWRVEVRRHGVYRSATFRTKAEAREWATAVERQVDTGQAAVASTATLADAFSRYAREVSPNKRGARWERLRLQRLEASTIADIRLQALGAEDIIKWRDRRAQAVKAGTVNRELSLLRSVLKQCRTVWQWLDRDPMQHVARLPTPPPRDRRISEDEIQRLCWALGFDGQHVRTQQQQVAVAFLLALETGMRLGEICGIKPADVHGRHVRLQRTKTGQPRDVPLSREAVRLLQLVGHRFTVPAQSASVLFMKARKRASIDGLTFHDSRHEACTRLARKLDVLDLARMLGHSDLRSLRTYYNATPAEIAARLDAADGPTVPLHRETSADGQPAESTAENPAGK